MGNTILLKIAGDDKGALFFWYRNNGPIGGTEQPSPIGRLAGSFREFVTQKLFALDNRMAPEWRDFLKEKTYTELEL